LEDGEFDVSDIEHSILTGSITATQTDERGEAVDGKKYVIEGTDICGLAFATCGKIVKWPDEHHYFLITAYKVR
jgi:hypothetical protein